MSDLNGQQTQKALPAGWRWVRLGDVCEEKTGIRNPSTAPDSNFTYVDISSVDNKLKRIVEPNIMSGSEAPSRARQVIHSNDVIVSTTRPNLNAVALVPTSLDNQICSTGFCVLRAKTELDPTYLFTFVQSTDFVKSLSDLVKGALYPAVTDRQVHEQLIPLPPLPEQKCIAVILTEQMAAIEKAHAATEAQLQAAKALPSAYLREVFESAEARQWPRQNVSGLCNRIDYGFTASADFTRKEPRFLRITDIQHGRVNWETVPGCQISESEAAANRLADGDIVFARTGGTTGKSFLIKNPPYAVFASYLIRLQPKERVLPEFLYAYFQSDGYRRQIRQNARGGAQPNVNASLLGNIIIPLAPLPEQERIISAHSAQLAAIESARHSLQQQLTAIEKLPATLLQQAFSGKLIHRHLIQVVKPDIPSLQAITMARCIIAAYIINRFYGQRSFGRTQLAKDLYLAEAHAGLPLRGQYLRKKWGPLDERMLEEIEATGAAKGWFSKVLRDNGSYEYRPGPNIGKILELQTIINDDHRAKLDKLFAHLQSRNTRQVEAIATLYAAWNDLLLDGVHPTEDMIISEMRENWHPAKAGFTPEMLRLRLRWMRHHGFVPTGTGPRTEKANGS